MEVLLEVIEDTAIDFVKLLPFLFLTYLFMEWLESHAAGKTEEMIKKAGRLGPIVGGVLGVVPQCGFSAASSNFFAGRVISMGTLLAVFLSTSDEMLPIMLADGGNMGTIGKILLCKAAYAVIVGFVVDAVIGKISNINIHEFCESNDCECDDDEGILKPAIKHTVKTGAFILVISLIINVVIGFVGEEALAGLFISAPVAGNLVASLVGLIPNCAASVVMTQLYLEGVLSFGCLMSGLLTGAGVGILVLCRVNHRIKENVTVISLLYATGVIGGLVMGFILG